MEQTEPFQILLFYKYVYIENPEEVKSNIRTMSEKLGLTGRFIIATEGINGTCEGTVENTEMFIKELEKDKRFANIHWKRSPGTGKAFPRLSVKVRSEIVAAHLGTCDIDPNVVTGKRLKPEELHEWIKNKKEFYIVDMRNAYEHAVGYFENSILPALENFRDLPNIIESIAHLKNKTVLTVCTGGVRCEKASGFLITQGFNDVYQLDGGIVSYMEKYPNEDFLGKLYVFDNRNVMGFYTDDPNRIIVGKCYKCNIPAEIYTNCADDFCHRHLIVCESCLGGKTKPYCSDACEKKALLKSLAIAGGVITASK